MLLALAMVLSYVEAMIPINIGVPGVKLGLPNIVTVIGLYSIGALPTLVISFLRILLVTRVLDRRLCTEFWDNASDAEGRWLSPHRRERQWRCDA